MPRQTVNEKPKKFKKTLKEMAGYLKPYFPLILIAVVAVSYTHLTLPTKA